MRAALLGVAGLAGCGSDPGPVAPGPAPAVPGPVAPGPAAPGPGQAAELTGTVPGADHRGYVGNARCLKCHADQHQQWQRSLHAKSLRPASTETIHAPFHGDGARVGTGKAGFEVFERDGTVWMRCLGPDGEMGEFEIHYSIGDGRAHMLIHRFDDGRLQVLPGFVDIKGKYWFPYWEFFFDVGSEGPVWPDDYRFWANPGRGFNASVFSEMCIHCHTTGPERRYDPATNTYDTRWIDMNVSCEACHGPGASHVERREYLKRGLATEEQAANWVPLKMLEGEQVMESCAQCHASKQQLQTGYRPGLDWYQHYMPVLLDDVTHVYPDGKFKELNYNWLAVQQSPCFTKGGAVCTTCHDAHGSDHTRSLRRPGIGDAACLECHRQYATPAARAAHTHHAPDSAGSHCVECHMPNITIENGHGTIRDHTMSIPRPRNHRRHGIPDACTTCHTDRRPEWAETQMREWWPDAQPAPQERLADVIAGGRAGDADARIGLLQLVEDRSAHWVARASAARLLAGEAYRDHTVRDALLAVWTGTGDHPVMRPSALYGLLGHADDPTVLAVVREALFDAQLAARQYAAFGLVYRGDASWAKDCRRIISEIVQFLPDNVDHRGALAQACALDGDPEAAWGHWEICIRIFPMSRTVLSGSVALCNAQAEAARAQGDAELEARWRERALVPCDAYIAKRPAEAWGRVQRAHSLAAAGRLSDALVDLSVALRGEAPPEQRRYFEQLKADLERRLAAGEGR